MSLKSRIREAQREAARRLKLYARNGTADNDTSAKVSSQNEVEDNIKDVMPTVEQIRTALLRKSSNGRKEQ